MYPPVWLGKVAIYPGTGEAPNCALGWSEPAYSGTAMRTRCRSSSSCAGLPLVGEGRAGGERAPWGARGSLTGPLARTVRRLDTCHVNSDHPLQVTPDNHWAFPRRGNHGPLSVCCVCRPGPFISTLGRREGSDTARCRASRRQSHAPRASPHRPGAEVGPIMVPARIAPMVGAVGAARRSAAQHTRW